MKKYLMMGAVALAMSSTFVSCSKDTDYFDPNNEGIKMAEYTTAFVKTFGEPAADQNWGFGATRVNGNMTRSAVIDGDPFTIENTDSYYKDAVPEGVKTATAIIAECTRNDWGGQLDENKLQTYTDFELTDGTYSFHLWQGSRNFYVSGEVTLNATNDKSINKARIYLLPNSKLTLNMSNYINDMEIYVAQYATLNYNCPYLYKQGGGGKIYNRGTVNLPDDFQVNNDGVFYNEGTVEGKNVTSGPGSNNPSFFYNFGDLNLTTMVLNSCANFYNEGNVKVTNETSVTQAKLYWINKGHYTTGSMTFSAWNTTFYNFCQLIVEGNLHMFDGQFNLMSNSYTEAATAEMDNFFVNMGGNTGIHIKGNVTMLGQGDGTFQGFRAINNSSNNYVLIDGKVTIPAHHYTFCSTAGVTTSVNDIDIIKWGREVTDEELKDANDGDYPTVDLKGTICPYGDLSVTANTTDCGATWIIDDQPVGPSLCVLAEDLCAKEPGEFDFNDVVIDVYYVSASEVKIILRAAGGTVPLRICQNDNWEIHKLFGVPVTCMVNTGTKYHTAKLPYTQAEKPYVELSYTGFNGWSDNQDTFNTQVNHQIKLEVGATDEEGNILDSWVELKAQVGQAAQKVAMPVDAYVEGWYNVKEPKEHWAWEKQYVGDGFKEWVIGQSETFYQIRRRR